MEGRGIVILIANNRSYKGRSLAEPYGFRQISLGYAAEFPIMVLQYTAIQVYSQNNCYIM